MSAIRRRFGEAAAAASPDEGVKSPSRPSEPRSFGGSMSVRESGSLPRFGDSVKGGGLGALEELLRNHPRSPSPDDPLPAALPEPGDSVSTPPLQIHGHVSLGASATGSPHTQGSHRPPESPHSPKGSEATPLRRFGSAAWSPSTPASAAAGTPHSQGRARRASFGAEEVDSGSDDDELAEMRCPVCLDPFAAPVTLQCGHHVCKQHVPDLAATCATKAAGAGLRVECPKCRVATTFESEAGIKVNAEMKAIVDAVVRMLAKRRPSHDALATPRSNGALSTSSAQQTPLRSEPGPTPVRSALRRRPSAASVGDASDSESVHSAASRPTSQPASARRRVSFALPPGESDPDGTAAQDDEKERRDRREQRKARKAQQRLQEIERRLGDQRQQAAKEREAATRAKVAEYKRLRQQELEARIAAQQAVDDVPVDPDAFPTPEALRSPAADDADLVPDLVPARAEETVWQVHERAFAQQRRKREEQREAERQEREARIRAEVADWMSRGTGESLVGAGQDEVRRQVQRLAAFEASSSESAPRSRPALYDAGSVLGARSTPPRLTDSAKGRIAELRLPDMPSPEERRRQEAEAAAALAEAEWEEEPIVDVEVERRLLEVDRMMVREQDDELSRAEKARLAEERARKTIGAFMSQQRSAQGWQRPSSKPAPHVPLGVPTYSTKKSRLRPL